MTHTIDPGAVALVVVIALGVGVALGRVAERIERNR